MEIVLAKNSGSGIIHPEDEELQRKRAELEQLEEELAQCELELAMLQEEVEAFRKTYVHRLGPLLSELADLEAKNQEAQARLRPDDATLRESAREARQQAEEARQAAKAMHPDLATDEEDRKLRTRMMAEVNAAFAAGDEARIEQLLKDWLTRPEAVQGEGTVAELVRVIRKIAQVRKRLDEIRTEMNALSLGEWNELRLQADACERVGQDFFGIMKDGIGKRIDDARTRFETITSLA